MKSLFILLCFCSFAYAGIDDEDFGSIYLSSIVSVYDGDTFRANINKWPDIIGKRISIRVAGVDTPEIRGSCEHEIERARAAKQYTVSFLRNGMPIRLDRIRRDKYFRILADVMDKNNKNLAIELIRRGLGVQYKGKTKDDWCD